MKDDNLSDDNLSDEMLLDAYHSAVNMNLGVDFLNTLLMEIYSRGINNQINIIWHQEEDISITKQ